MKIDLKAIGKTLFAVDLKMPGYAYVEIEHLFFSVLTPHNLNCTMNGNLYTRPKQKSVKYMKVNLSQFLLQNSKSFIFVKFITCCILICAHQNVFPRTFSTHKMRRYSKFLWSIALEKQQKCEAKYFVPYTKVSSHNNNIQAWYRSSISI